MKLKQYPKYKDSGVQWIGEIPKEWTLRKLSRFLYFQEGPGLRNWQFTDDGMKVLTVSNITPFGINWLKNELFISENEYKTTYKHFSLEKNDLVFASSGITMDNISDKVSRVKKSDLPAILNTSTIRIHPKRKDLIQNFFYWFLRSDVYGINMSLLMTGSCQFNFGPSHLNQTYFILPSEKEQTQIASFLDKKTQNIDQTIEKDKKLIELLKEKRIALINHVVTKGLDKNAKMKDSEIDWIGEIPERWKVKKLKFIADVKVSNVDKKSVIGEPEIKLCNYTDVYYNEYITSKIDFMKRTCSFEQKNKFMLEKGDVMITKDSETADDIAVPAVSKEKFGDVVCGYHLSFIRPKQEIIGDFLFRLFQSKLINSHFERWALGVTRFGVSTYPIKNSLMILSPKQTQLQIVQYLDKQTTKIDQTINKIQEKITLMQEYKKSLIHHVVTGKVDVRGIGI